ncbi:hypothetical protein K461DRAFT_269961 [Myriangium duriaei CBS 260.36]|uniref:F-box domain-containing protein n=1 Tax=Myriangium duriaei CBS 260.36 TaxID=1168546 RepID=A0A9P4IZH4_9PEZI|nr:hypothetical protein K461DRAFT_269961 [Myriangium duriaei CBS 260.36]
MGASSDVNLLPFWGDCCPRPGHFCPTTSPCKERFALPSCGLFIKLPMEIAAWTEVLEPPPAPFQSLGNHMGEVTDKSVMLIARDAGKRRDSLLETDGDDESKNVTVPLHLLALPADVLLLLSDHLPPASGASLRLTCRALHQIIPIPEKPLRDDICARTAIYRHVDERRDIAEGKHRCALCKALYSDSQFRRSRIIDPEFSFTNFAATKALGPTRMSENSIARPEKEQQYGYTSQIPSTRICAWHINRFIFPPSAALSPDPTFDSLVTAAASSKSCSLTLEAKIAEGGWASSIEPVCMHCGRLVICVCSVGNCDTCTCDCASCGVRRVRCWWKLARVGRGPTRDASFKLARHKWLIARAEEMDRFGWEGVVHTAGGMLDWGLVRVGKCAHFSRLVQSRSTQLDRKRKAEEP